MLYAAARERQLDPPAGGLRLERPPPTPHSPKASTPSFCTCRLTSSAARASSPPACPRSRATRCARWVAADLSRQGCGQERGVVCSAPISSGSRTDFSRPMPGRLRAIGSPTIPLVATVIGISRAPLSCEEGRLFPPDPDTRNAGRSQQRIPRRPARPRPAAAERRTSARSGRSWPGARRTRRPCGASPRRVPERSGSRYPAAIERHALPVRGWRPDGRGPDRGHVPRVAEIGCEVRPLCYPDGQRLQEFRRASESSRAHLVGRPARTELGLDGGSPRLAEPVLLQHRHGRVELSARRRTLALLLGEGGVSCREPRGDIRRRVASSSRTVPVVCRGRSADLPVGVGPGRRTRQPRSLSPRPRFANVSRNGHRLCLTGSRSRVSPALRENLSEDGNPQLALRRPDHVKLGAAVPDPGVQVVVEPGGV